MPPAPTVVGPRAVEQAVHLLAPLPVYAAFVVWFTWPLLAHAGTHLPDATLPCRFDLLQMTWALAHQSRALVTTPWAIADANIFHPTPHSENPAILTQTPWTAARGASLEVPSGLFRTDVPMGVAPLALVLIAVGTASVLASRRTRAGLTGRAWRHGAFWTALGVVLSLPPTVRPLGVSLPLGPLSLASWVPALREVQRLGIVGLFGVRALAGLALAECGRRLRGLLGPVATWSPAALALAVAYGPYAQYARGTGVPPSLGFEPLPATYPLFAPSRPAPVLLDLLRRPGGPLVEVPATVPRRPWPDVQANARAMHRSIFHGRRLLNGYNEYYPAAFPARMACRRWLESPTRWVQRPR